MKKIGIILVIIVSCSFAFQNDHSPYIDLYQHSIDSLEGQLLNLTEKINSVNKLSDGDIVAIKDKISLARIQLKRTDFWLRYLEPVCYKKINGPLPVEWENEVFEKFEKPYKREGAGLTLAYLYLAEKDAQKDSLAHLINISIKALDTYRADSITKQLRTPDHFFLCNRLFLLDLASIYTTGFDCPDNDRIVPELLAMLVGTKNIYETYNKSYPSKALTKEYLLLYDKTIDFVTKQPTEHTLFDHYHFIKDHVNPLFAINQRLIRDYSVMSKSYNDYTLNDSVNSIFNKALYRPQNTKGIYSLVEDKETLNEIRSVGKLLFYDPILSGNNLRSCASCHKPEQYFTDTTIRSALHFDQQQHLQRNTPSLVNVVYNHLLMLDGKHFSLQDQATDVMTNPSEMGCGKNELVEKVLSCKGYRSTFKNLLRFTPEEKEVTVGHIISAITYYYSSFSSYYAPFDEAMNDNRPLAQNAVNGFNLFMGKAKCGTCHYVPQFNGVPPPFISSEFEVIGVPADTSYLHLSEDNGRFIINPAFETRNAFRVSTVRNTQYTKPYMHNGIFNTLDEVIDFYDAGGGVGKKLAVLNQTLSPEPLKLTAIEKRELIAFIHSLNEHIIFEKPPEKLPVSFNKGLNTRVVGGRY